MNSQPAPYTGYAGCDQPHPAQGWVLCTYDDGHDGPHSWASVTDEARAFLSANTLTPVVQPTATDLVHVGWYCWRCHGINAQACRSDSVPVHVPREWATDMEREIAEQENEETDE